MWVRQIMFQLLSDKLESSSWLITVWNKGAVISQSILKSVLRINSKINSPPLQTKMWVWGAFIKWMERRPRCFVYHSSCENSSLLRYYAASSDNSLPTFRNKLSVRSSKVKNPSCNVITGKSAILIYFTAEAWNCSFFMWIWQIESDGHSVWCRCILYLARN
jgi:hypothetical protein